jgi:hypothetical protein
LTVALGGSPMSTFLQEEPFYSGRDVSYLVAKLPMTRETMLYYATCLQANRYRFSYGRQANRSLASLLIPALSEVPPWVGSESMEEPGSLWQGVKDLSGPLPAASKLALLTRDWKCFTYDDLFKIDSGKPLTKEEMQAGQTPFIGATEYNNGVTSYIGQAALHKGGVLTLSFDGSIGESFFQPDPFWPSEKVRVLTPRTAMSRDALLFILTLIRLEQYRYNYGRKWRLDVMKASKIRLPVTEQGDPDWFAMENVIRGCPAHVLLSQSNRPVEVPQ